MSKKEGSSGKVKNGHNGSHGVLVEIPQKTWAAIRKFDYQKVKQAAHDAEPYVQDRPYLALGIAAALGFLLGSVLMPKHSR